MKSYTYNIARIYFVAVGTLPANLLKSTWTGAHTSIPPVPLSHELMDQIKKA